MSFPCATCQLQKYPLEYRYPCWESLQYKKSLFSLVAYIISNLGRLLLPVSVVLDVPPLDLQGVGWRARPTEGASHLYILTALGRDVVWHLCKESCKRKNKKFRENDGLKTSPKRQKHKSSRVFFYLRELSDNISLTALLHHTSAREKLWHKVMVAR